MTGGEPDEDLLRRYREASDAQPAAPSQSVRAAILAEGRAAAARHAAAAQAPLNDVAGMATASLAARRARRFRWLYPLIGTASAAALAGILVLPRFLPAPSSTSSLAPDAQRAPVPELAAAPAPRAAPAAPGVALRQERPTEAVAPAVVEHDAARTNQSESVQAYTAPAQANASVTAQTTPNAAAPVAADVATTAADKRIERGAGRADAQASGSVQAQSSEYEPAAADAALLFAAVRGNDLNQLRQALATGSPSDARDAQGRTPLLLAIELGRETLVAELLQQGADPDAVDRLGHTPLALAHRLQRDRIVQMLERAGAHELAPTSR
ncbi:MAG: ankyrin repeat domain-containing protein [Steroidobacteraceae bacterium]